MHQWCYIYTDVHDRTHHHNVYRRWSKYVAGLNEVVILYNSALLPVTATRGVTLLKQLSPVDNNKLVKPTLNSCQVSRRANNALILPAPCKLPLDVMLQKLVSLFVHVAFSLTQWRYTRGGLSHNLQELKRSISVESITAAKIIIWNFVVRKLHIRRTTDSLTYMCVP